MPAPIQIRIQSRTGSEPDPLSQPCLQEATRRIVEESCVVVTTLMTATQSGHISRLLARGHFGLVAVDEAGFTPGKFLFCNIRIMDTGTG
jgi:hypothetical protein